MTAFAIQYRDSLQEQAVFIWSHRSEILHNVHLITQAGLAAFAGYLGWKLMTTEDSLPYYPFALALITYETVGKFLKNAQTEKNLFLIFQRSLPINSLAGMTLGSVTASLTYYFGYHPQLCEAFSDCKKSKDEQENWFKSCRFIMNKCQEILADESSYQIWPEVFKDPTCLKDSNFSLLENSHFYYTCSSKVFDGPLAKVSSKFCVNFFPKHSFKKIFDAANCISLEDEQNPSSLMGPYPIISLTTKSVNLINQIFSQLYVQYVQCAPYDRPIMPEIINQNLNKVIILSGITLIAGLIKIEGLYHKKIIERCANRRENSQYREVPVYDAEIILETF